MRTPDPREASLQTQNSYLRSEKCVAQQEYTTFETKNGFVGLAWNQQGVCGLRLPTSTQESAEAAVLERLPQARHSPPPPTIVRLISDIQRYFEGEKIDFSTVAVDLGSQEPFFSRIYAEVRKLGWGETTTYGSVAKTLGAEPQAAQGVGQAMASNPVPLIVPCHRVLAAGGKLGGFSAPGGSGSKAKMLEIEGVTPAGAASRDQAKSDQIGLGL
jgi:methylated-DNA-[protein]-cysteine S-methyltransferase